MTTAGAAIGTPETPRAPGADRDRRAWIAVLSLAALPLAGLVLGLAARAAGQSGIAAWAWSVPTFAVLGVLAIQVVTHLARGDVGLDLVALLAMGGALALAQPLAGVVIALMYAGGQALDAYAAGRAGQAMTALLARQPRTAQREEGGAVREVPIGVLVPGDRILVRTGDVLPVDGRVTGGPALLDQATLTGEALPVAFGPNAAVVSGTVNAGPPFVLLAERRAAESTYAGIVRLVAAARARKAPMVRLADRYGLAFLGLTLLLAGGAWAATGDPLRALAVLVVATPCPLILAVPVALVSGLSRAAGLGVLVKGGGALERLARVRVLVVDKTGTLTVGTARLTGLRALAPFAEAEVLALAASLDQASGHPLARALVETAQARGLSLTRPQAAREMPGAGMAGRVAGHDVRVGGPRLMATHGIPFPQEEGVSGEGVSGAGVSAEGAAGASATVLVAVDGRPAGILTFADPLRQDVGQALADLWACGIALQSVAAGLGLSLAGMAAAAAGHLSPLHGALLQEAIDIAVILNALRALGGPTPPAPPPAVP